MFYTFADCTHFVHTGSISTKLRISSIIQLHLKELCPSQGILLMLHCFIQLFKNSGHKTQLYVNSFLVVMSIRFNSCIKHLYTFLLIVSTASYLVDYG